MINDDQDLRIDSHNWIRALRLEYFHVAQIRELRLGEQFWIGYFLGPGVTPDTKGHCEAYIERVRGGYRFHAIWTICMGKSSRPHIMTYGEFNLLPGNIIKFASENDLAAEKAFRKVCRYVAYIVRHAKEYGITPLYHSASYHCHALYRYETIRKSGCTRFGVEGPEIRGLGAIVETAIALGAVPMGEDAEDESSVNALAIANTHG